MNIVYEPIFSKRSDMKTIKAGALVFVSLILVTKGSYRGKVGNFVKYDANGINAVVMIQELNTLKFSRYPSEWIYEINTNSFI